jgi:anti-sigma factor RsiW
MVEEMACIELVERVTDYLEGRLTPDELAQVQAHLSSCDGCRAHIEQVRTAVRILQTTPEERLSPAADDRLTSMFRSWAQGGSAR